MIKINIIHGPDKSKSFEIHEDKVYIGRSPVNDIQVKDLSVSRRHLRVTRRDNNYFVMDLKSTNGTFINGEEISPWKEVEVQEGIPIVMGMTVIGFNETRLENVLPFLDSIHWSYNSAEKRKENTEGRQSTEKKNMELVTKVSHQISLLSGSNVFIGHKVVRDHYYLFGVIDLVYPKPPKLSDSKGSSNIVSQDQVYLDTYKFTRTYLFFLGMCR